MDEIQKVLIKEGRKDLAQRYYEKVSNNKKASNILSDIYRKYPAYTIIENLIRAITIGSRKDLKDADFKEAMEKLSQASGLFKKHYMENYYNK